MLTLLLSFQILFNCNCGNCDCSNDWNCPLNNYWRTNLSSSIFKCHFYWTQCVFAIIPRTDDFRQWVWSFFQIKFIVILKYCLFFIRLYSWNDKLFRVPLQSIFTSFQEICVYSSYHTLNIWSCSDINYRLSKELRFLH